jgi:hypothetical protein
MSIEESSQNSAMTAGTSCSLSDPRPHSYAGRRNHHDPPSIFSIGFSLQQWNVVCAPLVAHKAAQVLQAFLTASANLLRALLFNSGENPEPRNADCTEYGIGAPRRRCGTTARQR